MELRHRSSPTLPLDFGLLKKRLENAVEEAILDTEPTAKHDGRSNGKHDLLDKEEPWQWVVRADWASVSLWAGSLRN